MNKPETPRRQIDTQNGQRQILNQQREAAQVRQEQELQKQRLIANAVTSKSDYKTTFLRLGEDAADVNEVFIEELTQYFQQILRACKVTVENGKPTATVEIFDYETALRIKEFDYLAGTVSRGCFIVKITANNSHMSKRERNNFKVKIIEKVSILRQREFVVVEVGPHSDREKNENFKLTFSITAVEEEIL